MWSNIASPYVACAILDTWVIFIIQLYTISNLRHKISTKSILCLWPVECQHDNPCSNKT